MCDVLCCVIVCVCLLFYWLAGWEPSCDCGMLWLYICSVGLFFCVVGVRSAELSVMCWDFCYQRDALRGVSSHVVLVAVAVADMCWL